MDRWATFDCYGTLVDWNAGLAGALGDEALLARYHEVEPVVQAESPGLSYREVMDTVIGLFELALYIVAVLGLSMALTWVVIKISPSESAKEQKAQAKAQAEGNST